MASLNAEGPPQGCQELSRCTACRRDAKRTEDCSGNWAEPAGQAGGGRLVGLVPSCETGISLQLLKQRLCGSSRNGQESCSDHRGQFVSGCLEAGKSLAHGAFAA